MNLPKQKMYNIDVIKILIKSILLDKTSLWGEKDFRDKNSAVKIGNLICRGKDREWVTAHKEGGSYSGTGDIFASVLSAGMVKGTDTVLSVKKAVSFLSRAIHDTVLEGTDRNEGVCFEAYLHELR